VLVRELSRTPRDAVELATTMPVASRATSAAAVSRMSWLVAP
jgi:hypothetical protein